MSTSFLDGVELSALSALHQLRVMVEDGRVPDPTIGICDNVLDMGGNMAFRDVVNTTRLLTGLAFPIEGSFHAYRHNTHKWNGDWLAKRLALIDQLIEHLEKAA